MMPTTFLCVFTSLLLLLNLESCHPAKSQWTLPTELGDIRVEVVTDSIDVPFGMAFISADSLLVTNRARGDILLVSPSNGHKTSLKGDGGALDILLHPNFSKNRWLYFSHAVGDSTGSTMAVEKARLLGDSLISVTRIFSAHPYYEGAGHYGSRMLFHNGFLYITMGERYDLADSAQSLHTHLGKVLRLDENGQVPPDNPFVGKKGALPEIWSYGHRNPQGLVFYGPTNQLLLHEHGPKGGDELNIVHPKANYGWPLISYGVNYDDTPVGTGMSLMPGMEGPLYQYTPSIAPCGMDVYSGKQFTEWRDNLFIGALAHRHLNRLVIADGKVVHEERILGELEFRLRSVKEGPDGYLYLGVDGGKILRILPGIN